MGLLGVVLHRFRDAHHSRLAHHVRAEITQHDSIHSLPTPADAAAKTTSSLLSISSTLA